MLKVLLELYIALCHLMVRDLFAVIVYILETGVGGISAPLQAHVLFTKVKQACHRKGTG